MLRSFQVIFIFISAIIVTKSEHLCVDVNLNPVKDAHLEGYKRMVSLACAHFYENEGWKIFEVETFPIASNRLRSFAAGYLEGYIYKDDIDNYFKNVNESIFHGHSLNNLTDTFVHDQLKHVRDIALRNSTDYEQTLKLLLDQYDGLYQGYRTAHGNSDDAISEEDFYLLTMQSDLEDILLAFKDENFTKEKECSGFVKLDFQSKNLIVGHNTHNMYTLMNRIYKIYKLNIVLSSGKKLNNQKFTSRPGDLNSKDDFYVLSNRMVVLETSLEVVNKDIYNLSPETIPKWIRVNLANKLSLNNLEWVDVFFYQNSGTHNNQWLLIDYNQFRKFMNNRNTEPKEIVYIVEQSPRLDRRYYEDVTNTLIHAGYFASYNAPYFPEVIMDMGYASSPYNQKTYYTARRFKMFQELQKEVSDVESMKPVLRYHKGDELCDTIAPRCDLVENRPFGAVDAKIIDLKLLEKDKLQIIYGPSFVEGITEPFDFSKYSNWTHFGIPERFEFKWILV